MPGVASLLPLMWSSATTRMPSCSARRLRRLRSCRFVRSHAAENSTRLLVPRLFRGFRGSVRRCAWRPLDVPGSRLHVFDLWVLQLRRDGQKAGRHVLMGVSFNRV